MSLAYFLLSLGVIVLIIVIRVVAITRYCLERRGYAQKSVLGSLGDSLSNTPSVLFSAVLFATSVLSVNLFLVYLQRQTFYDELQVPIVSSILGIGLIILLHLILSVRGRVSRRTESIERDYQILGYEDLVLQKQLADLLHESESGDNTKSEVANRVLENLSKKENKTGDAVRRIMRSPEKIREIQGTKQVPRTWRYLRFTYIVAFAFVTTLVLGTLGRLFGYFTIYDIIMRILPLAFILMIAFVLCLCIEGTSSTEKRRRAQYGI